VHGGEAMTSLFRLKKEAVPFFKKRFAAKIKPFDFWDSHKIDMAALEEVKTPYISFGHVWNDSTTKLARWCSKNGSEIHFTLNFNGMSMQEHDLFTDENNIRNLMEHVEESMVAFYFNKISDDIDAEIEAFAFPPVIVKEE
jgi:hypothetical protein